MSKMSTDLIRHALNGPVMGTRWSALFFAEPDFDPAPVRAALQAAVELVDAQMSTWKPGSDLMRLNGIAKGYGVDRLAEVLYDHGIRNALAGIDGEMRAMGLRPGGTPWAIAVEAPDRDRRAPHSILTLQNAAVATSGDYRHWVTVEGRNLSHTMDPRRGTPLLASPASVSVIAPTCAMADAWATALMVRGADAGADLARTFSLGALFLMRDDAGGVQSLGFGCLFSDEAAATAPALGD
ncbi:FAD:protein FMN transferase [Pannonibacter phragmitetus]|uniref:FAD:protein FMN transferase n=1 Tax=Pannonibacter phragmitetus TaxID=121719 RepID=A0A0U3NAY4_9HYPH|nr:FAD:protein FMN transferase [Pannonibacter phragmitetus]ALV28523.1 hypothetical protein APZ00_16825 [Pannonibacter phragmitetus]